jgi:N6-L-threonylcarbamoyladenine synthase
VIIMIVLGIESSCDETAAALVADGRHVLSSVVASQVAVHHPYGGVVPELASRKHMEAIVSVVEQAFADAQMTADAIDALAATQGPGLVGSLLVGFSFAKAFAFARRLPWVGVDHLEGHINSVFLEPAPPDFPFVALLISGGHTAIYHVSGHTEFQILGQTRDDAVGEAYDKVAKMMGLGYPGGVVIDRLAAQGDPHEIDFPRPFLDKNGFDFSFSGIKTAVSRYIHNTMPLNAAHQADIAAAFQAAVIDVLVHKIMLAAEHQDCRHLAIVGGVAANRGLRDRIQRAAEAAGRRVHIPSVGLCGDNAAMIAAAGFHYLAEGRRASLDDDVYSRAPVTGSGA